MKKNLRRIAVFIAMMFLFVTSVFAYQVKDENGDQFSQGTMNGTRVLNDTLVLDYMSEDYDAPVSLTGLVQREMTPKVISDSNGNLYAVWSEDENDGGGYDIWFAKSTDGGATWENKVQVDDADEICEGNDYDAVFPDIVIDEDLENPTIYVVWVDNRDPFGTCEPFYNNVWFAATKDYGTIWSDNVMVNNYPTLSGIGGYGISYWLDHHEENVGGPKVAVSKSHEILVTWMSDQLMPFDYDVYFSKADNTYPDYVFDADRSSYCNTSVEEIYERPGCDDAKVDDNTNNYYSGVPAIDVQEGENTVVIAYEDERDTTGMPKTSIYAVTFGDYGSQSSVFPTLGDELTPLMGAPYRIKERSVRVDTDNGNTSKNPDVDFGGSLYIAWEETGPDGITVNGQNIAMSSSDDEGETYSSPLMVNGAATASTRMKRPDLLSVMNGETEDLYLLYSENETGLGNLNFTKYNEAGGVFDMLSTISGGQGSISSTYGNVIYDETTGMMYSIWNDFDGSDARADGTMDYDVYSSRSYDMGVSWGQIYPAPEDEQTYISREFKLVSPGSFSGMKIKWDQDISQGGEIKFQLRGAPTMEELANKDFTGPNNHTDYYYEYESDGTYLSTELDGSEYVQYKATFTPSEMRTVSPVLEEVEVHYGRLVAEGTCQVDSDCSEGVECTDGVCMYVETSEVSDEISEEEGEENGEEGAEEGEEGEEVTGDICDPFPDVAADDPNCPAIQFVYAEGIFGGYPDGTFGPDIIINRAETSKVVLEAFDKGPFEYSGDDLGFPDLLDDAWYLGYIEKGVVLGVLQGYPDGRFQPQEQVNRVELLKIFFMTSEDELDECVEQPYNDTPLSEENSWFTPFVCFTKDYGLMDPDNENNFNPADGMVRRDVAELFYRYDTAIGL